MALTSTSKITSQANRRGVSFRFIESVSMSVERQASDEPGVAELSGVVNNIYFIVLSQMGPFFVVPFQQPNDNPWMEFCSSWKFYTHARLRLDDIVFLALNRVGSPTSLYYHTEATELTQSWPIGLELNGPIGRMGPTRSAASVTHSVSYPDL